MSYIGKQGKEGEQKRKDTRKNIKRNQEREKKKEQTRIENGRIERKNK